MSDWHTLKLKEIGSVVTGKTPSSHNPEDFGSDMPFVTPTDYGNYGKWALAADRALSMSGIERLKGKVLPTDSILVTCIGSDMGKVVMNGFSVITNQQINAIIPDLERVVPDFAYYLLVHNYPTLRSYGESGTAVPILNKGDFEELEFEFPPIEEQRAIAEVLSSLDDKIDLLHRQNKTLESLAQTLFRHWFIEEAKDEWRVGTINDLLTVLSGYAFKSGDFVENGPHRLVTIKNVQDASLDLSRTDSIDALPEKMPNHCELRIGDILLSLTGNVGRCCLVDEDHMLLNQRVAKLVPKVQRDWAFTYLLFRQNRLKASLEDLAKGTAQANLSPIETGKLEISVPPDSLLAAFSDIVSPMIEKVLKNKNQARHLANLRDSLLPKLMNGEVRTTYG